MFIRVTDKYQDKADVDGNIIVGNVYYAIENVPEWWHYKPIDGAIWVIGEHVEELLMAGEWVKD